ncbi:MAG: hotdog fold thioesterase [Actinophytocola sp.]|nr:hotdog fold thioesterase [Actinophytocola sp.]
MSSATQVDPVRRAEAAAASDTQEFGDFFLSRFLGLEISYDDEEKTCSVRLPYAPHLGNPQGSVHGGIITTAMDISMGHLTHRFLSSAMTIEMNLRFFRPLTGDGTATARLLKPGRRLVHIESRMTDSAGRLVAHGVGSWHRLDAL